ncbi:MULTISPECIES: hypothetical protein [Burkholderia]|uniref:Lipoprotein n=1 Tax=Burkholderia glumae TaxID=337 RepID=A0ABY5BIK2_BURGL|nr:MULTISPECIES: hypothetical protein [Burkholderia]USS45381.1 hypothetical protein NFI99_27780 [Burkholderia glumae]
MNWRTIGLVGSLLLLAGCPAPVQQPPLVETRTKVIDTGCTWTKPIYLDKSDVLSDATARAVLAHNQAGAKECGWRPLNGK